MNKRKIMLIFSRMPYPPIGGDKLKNFNLLKILSKHFIVFLIILTDEKVDKKTISVLEKYTKHYKIFFKSKLICSFNSLKSIFNQLPLQVNYYYFKDVQNYINLKLKNVDFVINTLIRTSQYIIDANIPKYLDMVDSIFLNYKNSKKNIKSFFWKVIHSIEISRLEKYEIRCLKNYNKTFFVNKNEMNYWSSYGKTECIPNGVDKKLFSYNNIDDKYKNYVAFFGKMNYQPNIDAVFWFVEKVFRKLNNNIKFIIIGINPSKKIINLGKKYRNISITGFINDPYKILKSSLCIVSPMQTGGGIQNKILEAMALGTINIVSSLAAKPIGATNKKDYFCIDDPNDMAKLINNIDTTPDKFKEIKINSRKFIKNNFSWDIYEKNLIKMIEQK